MIGSKVVLTYKRKRLSSTPVLGFEDECPNRTHGCQTLEALKTQIIDEVSTHEFESRNPEKLNQSTENNGDSNVSQKCDYCHCSNEDNDRKKLCSSCVKQQYRLSTLEKVNNSCEDTMKVNKPDFPLITFSRRSRQKKTLGVTDVQEKSTIVEKYDLVEVKRSNSAIDNGCLLDLSTDLTGPDSNPVLKMEMYVFVNLNIHIFMHYHFHTMFSLSFLADFSSKKSTNEELANGTLLIDESSDESRVITSDDVGSAEITIDKKQDEGSLDFSGLSKPPPELSGLVDCNLTLESSFDQQPCNNVSENHLESTDSSRSRVLELLDQRIGVTSLPPGHSSANHMWGPDHPSVSIGQSQTSKMNFLQLFPEERVNDILRSNQTSNPKPLHLMGSTCSLPSFDFEARNITNFENTSLENGPQYPFDSVSLMRHKMMLDNILSKARAVKTKLSDSFDHPNVWSEEELDFLWIGVRRHGMGSWDAILRDPRLHFSSWRSPRELAERWELEQLNLLRTKPNEEPQRSNGFKSRSTFNPYLVNGPNGNLTLPHWLRGSFPPMRPVGVPSVSYTGHSGLMQWINQPFCGPNRTVGTGVTSGAAHWAQPLAQPIVAHTVSKPDEVIVIDSDVSSEDTVSDDHSVRN